MCDWPKVNITLKGFLEEQKTPNPWMFKQKIWISSSQERYTYMTNIWPYMTNKYLKYSTCLCICRNTNENNCMPCPDLALFPPATGFPFFLQDHHFPAWSLGNSYESSRSQFRCHFFDGFSWLPIPVRDPGSAILCHACSPAGHSRYCA